MVFMLVSPKEGLPIIYAHKKPTEVNFDPSNKPESKYVARNKVAPLHDSTTKLTPLLDGSYEETKGKKQVASGDHDSEFKEHKDSMNN